MVDLNTIPKKDWTPGERWFLQTLTQGLLSPKLKIDPAHLEYAPESFTTDELINIADTVRAVLLEYEVFEAVQEIEDFINAALGSLKRGDFDSFIENTPLE